MLGAEVGLVGGSRSAKTWENGVKEAGQHIESP